jgi:tetratricopeptide (TPR) repeat protein
VPSFYPLSVIISFSLDDLKKSLPGAAELAGLSGDPLREAVHQLLGTVADGATLQIDGGMVTLDFGDIPEESIGAAERLREKASKRAAKGELSKAAASYRRVMELNPSHESVRRELAMVLMESGKHEEAADLLLDALKANPRDPQALVILGNHYAREDGKREVAISLIRRACELVPEDGVAHNSLGALLLESEQPREAVVEFNEALRLDPTLANAWYGRAVAEIGLEQWTAARESLQSMFALGSITDRRQQQMLAEARDSFRRVTNIIGNDRAAESLKAVEELAARLGKVSGHSVTVREVAMEGLVSSRSRAAWTTGSDHHLVELDEKLPAEMVKHHLVCREGRRLLMEAEARKAGETREFAIPPESMAHISEALMPDIRRIARGKGYDPAKLAQVVHGLAESSIAQLRLVVQDIMIEGNLVEDPALKEAQFCSLLLQVHTATNAIQDSANRDLIPPKLNMLRDTLSAAMAVLLDRLSGGATEYAIQYTKAGVLPLARKIEALAYDHDGTPGSECHLIDQIAEMLGVVGWYKWRDDTSVSPEKPN